MMKTRFLHTTALLVLGLAPSVRLAGGDYEHYLREGNTLYAEGKYVEAEEKYILSGEEKPSSAIVPFNIGNSYFQREDYTRAIDHYGDALGRVGADRELEVRIRYNQATGRVRESERSIGDVTDPEKLQRGVDLVREAMTGYRDLLDIDPAHANARHNLAVCQLRIKYLLDTLKRLREEQAKKKDEEKGKDPATVLRELIAEQEEEIGLSRKADEDSRAAATLRDQAARVRKARSQFDSVVAAVAPAVGALDALAAELADLESDPRFVVGGSEISSASKALQGGADGREAVGAALARATERLETAIEGATSRVREGLESDRSKQDATRGKAMGLVEGIKNLLEGKAPPPGQQPPPGTGAAQPPSPPPPPPQPPPPEVAEALQRVNEHTLEASSYMGGVLALLGAEEGDDPDPATTDIIAGQEAALEALQKALEEAEKLPGEKEQQQKQPGDEGDQGDEQKQQDGQSDEKKGDKDGEEDKKDPQDPANQPGNQDKGAGKKEEKLSRQQAEELLRRFLRSDRDRRKDRKQRSAGRAMGRRTVDRDW